MKAIQLISASLFGFISPALLAAPLLNVTQGEESDLAATYDSADLFHGLIATELSGDLGWYPDNKDPADHLPAFTDGEGVRATGLTGLLRDFPGPGNPAKRIEYALRAPADVAELRVFSGNNGHDGRVFHTYTVRFSVDGARTFTPPIYVQSHPSGTLNTSTMNNWFAVLSQLTDTSGWLARRVTHVQLEFYAVDNTGGQMRDPYDGGNYFTGTNDGLDVAFVSPLIWEIDLLGQYSQPILTAMRQDGNLNLAWIGLTNGAVIQATTNLTAPVWLDLTPQPAIVSEGNTNSTTVVIGPGEKYLRVRY